MSQDRTPNNTIFKLPGLRAFERAKLVVNSLLFLNGGALAISLNPFLGQNPPKMSEDAMGIISSSWTCLFYSLALTVLWTVIHYVTKRCMVWISDIKEPNQSYVRITLLFVDFSVCVLAICFSLSGIWGLKQAAMFIAK
jgi:hypothetical protein